MPGVGAHGNRLDSVRLPQRRLRAHRPAEQAAVALKRGGVGYYSDDDFLHAGAGRVRTW
jgi:hypothetical protein